MFGWLKKLLNVCCFSGESQRASVFCVLVCGGGVFGRFFGGFGGYLLFSMIMPRAISWSSTPMARSLTLMLLLVSVGNTMNTPIAKRKKAIMSMITLRPLFGLLFFSFVMSFVSFVVWVFLF